MAESNCPICYSQLVVKQLTPCMDCGGEEFELDHYMNHKYNEYEFTWEKNWYFVTSVMLILDHIMRSILDLKAGAGL
jgi:hypothetical protein